VGLLSAQEDPRSRFYAGYHKEAEEYDKEFMKKYDEDLNTTLIFVSFVLSSGVHAPTRSQAGLFSAVASAFIIQVQSQVQPDPNDETAALLRVLLYKIDNTTFGNDVPALPQWTGPPRTIVQVQAILLASLAASLLSAFLAMLGKQWLNRYASTDMRGSAIERSQNRQRKLDGVVTWYFDHVMEALPLMLQIALLLLGCALSRYLWEINIILASVVFSVTSFGMTFYIFIIVAGTASESCPYQTPGARFFRHAFHHVFPHIFHHTLPHIFHHILPQVFNHTLRPIFDYAFYEIFEPAPFITYRLSVFVSSRFSYLIEDSFCHYLTAKWGSSLKRPWYSMFNIAISFCALFALPIALVTDVCLLVIASGKTACYWLMVALYRTPYYLFAFGRMVYRQLLVASSRMVYYWLLIAFRKTVYRWFVGTPSNAHGLDQQTIMLDLRCISWMLQTSLDQAVHLSTLKHLATMMTLGNFDPTLVSGCFDVFINCVKVDVSNNKVVIMQGLEQLATVSATCFLRTFHHLSVMDPSSSVLEDVRRRYSRVFLPETDFGGLPFYYTMIKLHSLANRHWNPRHIQWGECKPTTQEWISFTRGVAEVAQIGYQRAQRRKVPRWTLCFVLHSLSLDPPTSVVADCLSIIAIDLGCDVSNTGFTTLDERCVCISQMNTTLTLAQCTSGAGCEPDSPEFQDGSRRWRLPPTPIQAQGDRLAPPLRGSTGASWETGDARYVHTRC
jgi:hypothetical protein